MDAHGTVTAEEWGSLPPRPAKFMKTLWTLWAKALGDKVGDSETADRVAVIRTLIAVSYLVTNCFIVAGVIHHW